VREAHIQATMMLVRSFRLGVFLAFFTTVSYCTRAGEDPATNAGVQITQLPDRLHIEINGKLFTEYFFKDVPRPYCYPLLGPGEAAMTRNFPMKDTGDEATDHLHHRSLWFAHGSINGKDFWSEEKDFGKTVHQEFTEITSGRESGRIKSRNQWVAADGSVVCTDDRLLRIFNPPNPNERILDFEVTLHASNGTLTLGDTKEGTMAIRVAQTMALKGKNSQGHIVNSNGVRDGDTWGKRADWCDYYGPVNGKIVGVAIFNHPHNPRHPTWWHVRDYGLFAANPFGRHDFAKMADKKAGDLVVPAGQSVTFCYRFYFHAGDERQGAVAEKYMDYIRTVN
jgi:hypothetical protein